MKIRTAVIIFTISGIFWGCGPSQRELAVQKINSSKSMLSGGDTLKAIASLDSIGILFPEAQVQKGVAANIKMELYRQLIDSRMAKNTKLDSMIDVLLQNFNVEKTEFDQYAQYIPKRQSFNRSWDRSFLQINLNEKGDLFLSSNYMGKDWLNHTGIKVYDGALQATSANVPLDDVDNHRSGFLDYKWERVSYRNGRSDSVIHFIAAHPDLKLKCVFQGKNYYYILLEDYDVQAVRDALELAGMIKNKKALEDEIKGFREKLN